MERSAYSARMRAVVAGAIAAGLVAGPLLIFGLVNAGNGDAPTSEPDVRVELLQPYETSFIELWVRGCSSSESVAFCRCAIDEYTQRLRPDEFETLAAVANSPGGTLAELPENVRDAVKAVERDCR